MTKNEMCPIVETARLVGRKWDLIVIRYLMDGPKRFAELKLNIPDISSKSLSSTLKQLTAMRMVERKVESGFPISVIYTLTKKGLEMNGIIEAMRHWGQKWALPPTRRP
jgi:DNA-binding HxlR family transcriptional regulator